MTAPLSVKDRWLAALRREPVDRLPFWPKLDGAYLRARSGAMREWTVPRLHDWIGSDPHYGIPSCLREVRTATTVASVREGDTSRTTYTGPGFAMELVQQFDEGSQAWHPVRFPVQSREDILRMTRIAEDGAWEVDPVRLRQAREEAARIGPSAVTMSVIGTTPLMDWVEHLAGVEQGHWLLADYPNEVAALFAAMEAALRRKADLMAEASPADLLYLMENTSTTLISPDQFRSHCLPAIADVAARVRARNRLLVLHMCGHLKALLPDLARAGAHAFEAFTAPTLGNTTLLDGRTHCPDVCLIGGTHAMLWLQPEKAIIAGIEAALDPLPHHRGLVITSAGVMPPLCPPETLRSVARWLAGYHPRF